MTRQKTRIKVFDDLPDTLPLLGRYIYNGHKQCVLAGADFALVLAHDAGIECIPADELPQGFRDNDVAEVYNNHTGECIWRKRCINETGK